MFAINNIKNFNKTIVNYFFIIFINFIFLFNFELIQLLLKFIFISYDQFFYNIELNYILISTCIFKSTNLNISKKYSETEIKEIIFGSLLGERYKKYKYKKKYLK
jgi:hypothetical protein